MNKRMTKEQSDCFVAAMVELKRHNQFAGLIWPMLAITKDIRVRQSVYTNAFEQAAELMVVMKKSVASTDPENAQAIIEELKSKIVNMLDK